MIFFFALMFPPDTIQVRPFQVSFSHPKKEKVPVSAEYTISRKGELNHFNIINALLNIFYKIMPTLSSQSHFGITIFLFIHIL